MQRIIKGMILTIVVLNVFGVVTFSVLPSLKEGLRKANAAQKKEMRQLNMQIELMQDQVKTASKNFSAKHMRIEFEEHSTENSSKVFSGIDPRDTKTYTKMNVSFQFPSHHTPQKCE
jgi:hypothetical protein